MWIVLSQVSKARPGAPGFCRNFRIGGDTFEDGSGQWQSRLIPHQRIDLIAASEASVAIRSSNFV
jgi:hypothetical protein